MMVNPDVDGYMKTLNKQKILLGILLIVNQLKKNRCWSWNYLPKSFSVSNVVTEVTYLDIFVVDLSTILCFNASVEYRAFKTRNS